MKSKDIFEAIGGADHKYIAESIPENKKKKGLIPKILVPAAAALAIAVAVTAGAAMTRGLFNTEDPSHPVAVTSGTKANAGVEDNVPGTGAATDKTQDTSGPVVEPGTTNATTTGGGDTPGPITDPSRGVKALASPIYPKMVKLTGEDNYDEWDRCRDERYAYIDLEESIDDYVKKTVGAFLADTEEDENRVYSPLNVYLGLAMLAEVTEGETRAQILDLLDVSDIEALREQACNLWNANFFDDGTVTSLLSNSLWLKNGYEYNRETLDTLAEKYFASSFSGEPGSDEYDEMLQQWLNEHTGGLLEDMVDGINMDPRTVLMIASTIYYNASWEIEFNEDNNTEEIFHEASGDKTVTFMHDSMEEERYYWGDKFTATRKKLDNSGYMYFMLPDEGVTVSELLKDDNALDFISGSSAWKNKRWITVNLSVPKFDVSSELELSDILSALGVTDCFDPTVSDFTPLTDSGDPIYVGSVKHGARVRIDEEGTEATAYIAIEYNAGADDPGEDLKEIDFTLDRPFVFFMTGADDNLLFMGVVNSIQ